MFEIAPYSTLYVCILLKVVTSCFICFWLKSVKNKNPKNVWQIGWGRDKIFMVMFCFVRSECTILWVFVKTIDHEHEMTGHAASKSSTVPYVDMWSIANERIEPWWELSAIVQCVQAYVVPWIARPASWARSCELARKWSFALGFYIKTISAKNIF